MANKWRDVPIYGRASPFIRHSDVVFDVPVLKMNNDNNLKLHSRSKSSGWLRHWVGSLAI